MIVVSGEPRSGTSLMMQTLKHLGVPVVGNETNNPLNRVTDKDKTPELSDEERKEMKRRADHAQKMNPIGFYEIPGIVIRGVRGRVADKYLGKAIKIVTSGLPRRSQMGMGFGTDMEKVDKIILCLRNPKHIAISQQDLSSYIEIADTDSGDWKLGNMFKPSPMQFFQRTGRFLVWLDKNPDVKAKILTIDYDDMHLEADTQLNKIVRFLDIQPTPEQLKAAKDNILPSLKRSTKQIQWDPDEEKEGDISMKIYDSLKSLNTTACRALVEDRMYYHRLENVRWLDDDYGFGTWLVIDPSMYRLLSVNGNKTLPQLMINTTNRHSARMISTVCKFRTDSNEEYTIHRPGDIGDLTRKRIWCLRDGDHKSCEECEGCWNHGYNKGTPDESNRINNIKESETVSALNQAQ